MKIRKILVGIVGVILFLTLAVISIEGIAAEPVKIKIAQSAEAISFAPVYVARYNKYFEEEGIKVEVMITSGEIAITAQVSGDVEFGAMSLSHVFKAFDAGKELLSVANIMNRMTMATVIHRDALKEKGVTPEAFRKMTIDERLKLLKGWKLGVTGPGAMTDLVFRYLVKRAGYNPERDVNIVNVGGMGTAPLIAALQNRSVDSFMLSPPAPYETVAKGYGVIMVDGATGDLPEFKNFVYETLTVNHKYAAEKPEMVRKMAKAIARANNFIIENPEKTVSIMREFWPKLDPEVIKQSTMAVKETLTRNAVMDRAGIEAHGKFLFEAGFIKKLPPTEEGRFWTNKYLPR